MRMPIYPIARVRNSKKNKKIYMPQEVALSQPESSPIPSAVQICGNAQKTKETHIFKVNKRRNYTGLVRV